MHLTINPALNNKVINKSRGGFKSSGSVMLFSVAMAFNKPISLQYIFICTFPPVSVEAGEPGEPPTEIHYGERLLIRYYNPMDLTVCAFLFLKEKTICSKKVKQKEPDLIYRVQEHKNSPAGAD